MRKPRDYDEELKTLEDKARELKSRKVRQLGELVIATGADRLTANELAGALIVLRVRPKQVLGIPTALFADPALISLIG